MKGCWHCKTDHRLHLRSRVRGDTVEAEEVRLVRGGERNRPYLWVKGTPVSRLSRVVTVSGNARLRKIALAILAELDTKPRARKKR